MGSDGTVYAASSDMRLRVSNAQSEVRIMMALFVFSVVFVCKSFEHTKTQADGFLMCMHLSVWYVSCVVCVRFMCIPQLDFCVRMSRRWPQCIQARSSLSLRCCRRWRDTRIRYCSPAQKSVREEMLCVLSRVSIKPWDQGQGSTNTKTKERMQRSTMCGSD